MLTFTKCEHIDVAAEPAESLSVCEWAEKHLELSDRSTNYPGRFRTELTPYLREPLDAFGDPRVEQITLCTAAQVAKTTAILVMMAYAIDQAPGPMLLVLPNADLCKSFSKQRLRPLLDDCPRLAKHMPLFERKTKVGLQEIHFDRMTLALVGSNSPANLASRPVRYLFPDEVDKYPTASAREAAALNLAIKRTRAYKNRKIAMDSTPTTDVGDIWVHFLAGDQRYYYVPCPFCGTFQVLDFQQVKWSPDLKDASTEAWDLASVRKTAWFECVECRAKIEEKQKRRMVLDGEWRPTNESAATRWLHWSYQIAAWYAPWVTFGDAAAHFLKSKDHADDLRDWTNSTAGLPWIVRSRAAVDAEIRDHCGEYKYGEVPGTALALIMTVDVQENGCWFVIRAWSYGGTSWAVRAGFVQDWAELDIVRATPYRGADGGDYRINFCLIDSGDQTSEVYDYCAATGAVPLKGEHQYRQPGVLVIRKTPDGRLPLWFIDKGHACDGFYDTRLAYTATDPGWWSLPRDVLDEHIRGVLAWERQEETDKFGRKRYRWVSKSTRYEHLGDCEIYQEAAAFHFGFRFQHEIDQQVARDQRHGRQRFTTPDGRPFLVTER